MKGDLALVQWVQLRKFGQEHAGHYGTYTGDFLQKGILQQLVQLSQLTPQPAMEHYGPCVPAIGPRYIAGR